MTPKQKIKREILLLARARKLIDVDWPAITEKNVDELYFELDDYSQDLEDEFRQGGEKSNIDSPWSRHYESSSRIIQTCDDSWVGWTYWYGGGKHGNPEEIPWMDDAYNVNLIKEESKVVIVRTFEKVDE